MDKMQDDLPKGFSASAVAAAFKKPGRNDLGLIFSQYPCVLAALFTQNLFCAAPVQIDKEILQSGNEVRAIVANSGQANACTGEEGLKNCRDIQQGISKDLGIKPDEVLLLSTGVIGAQFDMSKWFAGLPQLAHNLGNADAEAFTRAFMTTDAFPKFASLDLEMSKGKVRLTVMAKGAGMICPDMATMLCVVLTDAKVDKDYWQNIFKEAVDQTFNRVTVDGDTSTNDTIVGLANGASGIGPVTDDDKNLLQSTLTKILDKVAYMLVEDGEGARKVMHIHITGAKDIEQAEQAARSVGKSQLVKTAIYGGDANWGRIVNAVGYSGINVIPENVTLHLCGIERFNHGQPVNEEREEELAALLKDHDIDINIDLGAGDAEYTLLASDLGHEYVNINADYRT